MNEMHESINLLDGPYDIFIQTTTTDVFPIRAHWHYFFEILYVQAGQITVDYHHDSYLVKKGEFILIHPKTIHCIYKDNTLDATYLVIKFDDKQLNTNSTPHVKLTSLFRYIQSLSQFKTHFDANFVANNHLIALFTNLLVEYTTKLEGYDVMIQSQLQQLFILILRHYKQDGLIVPETLTMPEHELIFNQILEYIDTHYCENIEVTNLATSCHMSYSKFSRQFKRLYGMSCKAYIHDVRINKAQDLLLFTTFDLAAISAEVGYSDSSHLIKQFKRLKKITPHQYRKLYRQ